MKFGATWCGPCQQIKAQCNKYFSQLPENIICFDIDIDENMEIYGWVAATGLYESPTFGGASWLAHATLMTGNWTKRQQDYKALMSSKFRSLPTYFQEAGLLPGSRSKVSIIRTFSKSIIRV